ncbi:hypothetical protein FVE85_8520 [Porphyridium purpureum]|uniref:Uncharacterized protein n=1 Tax=Porphyridium purpureum TaxID=35688 RepID=A0A5J4YIS8_PORPP|nr:hypothetical protein FVE85_8520 [Porphyridium purpureum]|eukprot:POR2765..scf257_31
MEGSGSRTPTRSEQERGARLLQQQQHAMLAEQAAQAAAQAHSSNTPQSIEQLRAAMAAEFARFRDQAEQQLKAAIDEARRAREDSDAYREAARELVVASNSAC